MYWQCLYSVWLGPCEAAEKQITSAVRSCLLKDDNLGGWPGEDSFDLAKTATETENFSLNRETEKTSSQN